MLVRSTDWSRTSLGASMHWPHELRTVVAMLLNARQPMCLFWGPDLVQIYNDACIPLASDGQHPAAMGRRGKDCRQALWPLLEPQLDAVMRGGPATWNVDQRVPQLRQGRPRDAWFSYGCSAVADATGAVQGVLLTCLSTTERVLADRRHRTALAVVGALALADGTNDIARTAMKALRLASADVPIAGFCRVAPASSRDQREARVTLLARTDDGRLGALALPARVLRELNAGASVPLSAQQAPAGPLREAPGAHDWLLVPARPASAGRDVDVFIAYGLHPRLAVDDAYLEFLGLLTDGISRSIVRSEALDGDRHHADLQRAIAALMQTNTELSRSQRQALTATRAKSAFLAHMSHEIRTPMSAIVGSTYLLRRDATEPAVVQRLDTIANAATHLLRIVNDVLDLSRIEAGKLTLATADLSVESLVAGSCALVADAARDKGLSVRIDMQPIPELLHGDSMRLSQALVNLLSNAIKYTDSGEVTVTVAREDTTAAGTQIRFVVADTGPGIAGDRLDSIFDAFERGEDARERGIGGTGLGLSITRHLVQLMGGEVGAESVEGRGSRFWFSVRLQAAQQARPDAPVARLSGRRALLVDDDNDAGDAIADLLRLLGLELDSVRGGAAAVALARAEAAAGRPFALVMIDRYMPGMDGLETARLLQALEGETPRLVLMSAAMDAATRHAAMGLGIATVLKKPLDLATTEAELATLFGTADAPGPPGSPPGASESLQGQRAAEAQLRQRHAGARILLVEDDPISQRTAADMLRLAGLQVDLADDGRAAVQRVEQTRYDAILMDMHMPELDGCSAARVIRLLPDSADTPIIAMTASAFNEDRDACLAAGMTDHVGKPVDPAILYDVLSHWLDSRRAPWPWTALDAVSTMMPPTPVAAAEDAERLRAFESVPGLSTATGLDFFAGHVHLYLRALSEFGARYVNGLDGDRPDGPGLVDDVNYHRTVGRAVHSLGGAAAMIGATDIREQAIEIERRIRDGAAMEPGLTALDDALRRLARALSARSS